MKIVFYDSFDGTHGRFYPTTRQFNNEAELSILLQRYGNYNHNPEWIDTSNPHNCAYSAAILNDNDTRIMTLHMHDETGWTV